MLMSVHANAKSPTVFSKSSRHVYFSRPTKKKEKSVILTFSLYVYIPPTAFVYTAPADCYEVGIGNEFAAPPDFR